MNMHRLERTVAEEIEHCLKRAEQERAAAQAAIDPSVRDAHFVMAERYTDRAHMLTEQTPEATAIPSKLWSVRSG